MDAQVIEAARRQAEICKVFGNANRILIVWALGDEEMSVGDIAGAIQSSLQNTSQHLRLMKDRGILKSRREQHTIYYWVTEHALMEGCRVLLGGVDGRLPQVAPPKLADRERNSSQED